MQTLGQVLQKKFIGTDELRKELTSILDKLPEEGGEIVVTQHGKPQAILVDLDTYLELQEQIADHNPKLIKDVNDAIADVKKGHGISAQKVFDELGI
jgi:prevent-host-death family protein